ncbi:UDP-xylose and UDP-N-acetylglucosamine transporter-like [Stegodyphus dumicola]|uniref:UDP-xylose and UDP-N-acetylglucosamine transporter-like n=1 Tax=Stegodyphus dumicola TaxID=202533 RepID=UPI0015AB3D98|nr:UDP-xylose and UDP-N-acetylglucosamine transporter-like [Stegodyphus dumicola]
MLYFFLTLTSCCSNVVLLEILMRKIPGCGNVVTFFQFLFIALEGFIFTTKFGTVKPAVPIKNYAILVVMFFVVSVSNNWAFSFNISMPLHMIFKSGSLVTSMLMGMLIFKRRYTITKYLSVLMVSVGIFIATWASQNLKSGGEYSSSTALNQSVIGILLLSFSLIVSAGLGIYQEYIFKKYGKHPREALFYSHALPLPGFLLLSSDIRTRIPLFSNSESIELFSLFSIPFLWICLIGNVLTQYICVRSVFTIATKYSSLTTTMLITLRKFISLIISIMYFKNPFTPAHWLGTFLVFTGTLLFTDFRNLKEKEKFECKEKEEKIEYKENKKKFE